MINRNMKAYKITQRKGTTTPDARLLPNMWVLCTKEKNQSLFKPLACKVLKKKDPEHHSFLENAYSITTSSQMGNPSYDLVP